MLFLTGLNHYWTLRVPQSSYISSLKFLQLGVKRLPFWCNASLTEDKSASIRRLSAVKHEPKGWGSHIHSRTGPNFPQATRSLHCERCSVRCDSSLPDYTSGNCWSWTQIKRKNIKIVYRYDKSWIHDMFCHDGKWKVHMCTLSLTVRRLRFLTLKLERYVLSQSCNHHMEKQRRYFPCELNFAVPSCL